MYFLISLICFTLRPGPPPADGNIQTSTEIAEITEIAYAEKITQNDNEPSSEILTRKHKRYIEQQFNYTVEYSRNTWNGVETTLPSFETLINDSSLNMNNETTNLPEQYSNEIDTTVNETRHVTDMFLTNGTDILPTLIRNEVRSSFDLTTIFYFTIK